LTFKGKSKISSEASFLPRGNCPRKNAAHRESSYLGKQPPYPSAPFSIIGV
jgi:hypothetical protein